MPVADPSAPAADVRSVVVPDGAAAQRVDRFVADATGLSRSHVQKLIADGRLTRDGVPLRARDVTAAGDRLVLDVPPPAPMELEPDAAIRPAIVYEDDDLL